MKRYTDGYYLRADDRKVLYCFQNGEIHSLFIANGFSDQYNKQETMEVKWQKDLPMNITKVSAKYAKLRGWKLYGDK